VREFFKLSLDKFCGFTGHSIGGVLNHAKTEVNKYEQAGGGDIFHLTPQRGLWDFKVRNSNQKTIEEVLIMKRLFTITLIILFGLVGLAYGQSARDVYKAVNKACLAASGSSMKDFDNAVVDARNEVDLFKGSQEAKKNPQFTLHIENALKAIREAQFARQFAGERAVKNAPDRYKSSLDKAERELANAKQFI
jgi:hypothetical protein